MALASQSIRSNRTFTPRGGLGRRLLVGALAGAGAIGGAAWLIRLDGEGGADAAPLPGGGSPAAPFGPRAAIASDASVLPEASEGLSPASATFASTPALSMALAGAAEASDAPVDAAEAAEPTSNAAATSPPPEPSVPPPAATPAVDAPPTAVPPATPRGNGFDGTSAPASAPVATAPDATAPEAALAEGLALGASDPVRARSSLSRALLSGQLGPADAKRASDALARIGAALAFTPVYNANDPHFFQYVVQSGDTLEKIVRRNRLGCDWRLVARINNVRKPEAIRVGQRLKLPKGPFSAVVTKRDHRVDLCMGAGSDLVVVTSLPCGLGAANGTPVGRFRVRAGSKLLNPEWTHPVTGERFAADDPKNPIGEHWLGLEGIDEANASLAGYGIHGTIEVGSIGNDESLGCVRLLADDVSIVWEALGDGSLVEIRP